VTEELAVEVLPSEGKWGRGLGYGSLVHRLFEMAIKGFLPEDEVKYIQQQLTSMGRDEDSPTEAKKALDEFRVSEIWGEVEASDEVYTEVPFAVPVEVENGEVLRGIIDLVYRTPEGWKIVDYKTNVTSSESEIRKLIDHYASQVNTYAEQWQTITGEEVVEKGLWFTASKHYISIE
jgi:ATP-dependent helicase/nuclease subunit A